MTRQRGSDVVQQPASTTRQQDRKRLKRYEPFYPVNALTPGSRCPHGHTIHYGDYCGVKDCMSRSDQRAVDASEAPLPTNPEDRAMARIAELQRRLDTIDPETDAARIMELRRLIQEQRDIIDTYSGQPTVYKPHPKLKGGK